MAPAIKTEIVTRETIKPSTPTPHDLKNFKLSLIDQFTPTIYIPLLLFYPKNDGDTNHHANATERVQKLKKSLSETLTRFYPLAGRLKDNSSIECNDDGADYIQAHVNCLLVGILKNPNADILKQLLPVDIESIEAARGSLLLVQTSFFECGGMAIGMCISHKIADASTMSTFIKSWATTAIDSSEVVLPLLMAASRFPPIDFSITMPPVELMQRKCVTRRLVFDASKIAALKVKSASESVQQPTRVEVVLALIWKCAMAASRSNLKSPRLSVLTEAVNLRRRIEPPLPEYSVGNLVGLSAASAMTNESDIELHNLVDRLNKGMIEFRDKTLKKLQGNEAILAICEAAKEFGNLATSGDIDFYNCTSWCKFNLYDANFGWGKPAWVSCASTTFNNVVVLMDTRDGEGIEAWLTLSEENMALFECNQELLEFASF